MKEDSISHGAPQRLADLLSLDIAPQKVWPKTELAAILRHQLDAPLSYDLTRADAADPTALADMTRTSAAPLTTFRDLFQHPDPPLAMLRVVNRFAKAQGQAADAVLPPDIASVLYYLSIGLALRHGERITTLDDAAILKGLAWVSQRDWLEAGIRSVCEACRAGLGARGS